jgi:hypothetical protein
LKLSRKRVPTTIVPLLVIRRPNNKLKKILVFFSLCLFLLLSTVLPAFAQIVTLTWDSNTEPEVVGYKIYYRSDTPTFPFNGKRLSEGTSPIVVHGLTTTYLTLNLQEDDRIYYFTATAVSNVGLESSFSNIVASEWIPYLLTPPNNAVIDTFVTFEWELPPTGYSVSFELLYGTDPHLDAGVMAVTGLDAFISNWQRLKLSIALQFAALLCLLITIRFCCVMRVLNTVCFGLCIGLFFLQVNCGGGGGGDDTGVSTNTSVPVEAASKPTPPLFTNVVTDIYDTEYQIADLQPDTQYYWKIVAVDNWGKPYESLTQKFSTLGY